MVDQSKRGHLIILIITQVDKYCIHVGPKKCSLSHLALWGLIKPKIFGRTIVCRKGGMDISLSCYFLLIESLHCQVFMQFETPEYLLISYYLLVASSYPNNRGFWVACLQLFYLIYKSKVIKYFLPFFHCRNILICHHMSNGV